jgi:predicted secreted protein
VSPGVVEQLPERVDLKKGEERRFTLPGLGTAGYMWQEQITGPADVLSITWQRGYPPDTEPAAIGVAAPETATIRAMVPGEVTLTFVQIRPWERGVAPKREQMVRVRVTQ